MGEGTTIRQSIIQIVELGGSLAGLLIVLQVLFGDIVFSSIELIAWELISILNFLVGTFDGAHVLRWGEMQSVLQLAVALNAIYLGLRDIRNPHVRSEEKALLDVSNTLKVRADNAGSIEERDRLGAQRDSLSAAYAIFAGELLSFDKKNSWVGRACLTFIVSYIVLLIYSSYNYGMSVNNIVGVVIQVFGFIPISLGFILNVLLVRAIKKRVRTLRLDIEEHLIQ